MAIKVKAIEKQYTHGWILDGEGNIVKFEFNDDIFPICESRDRLILNQELRYKSGGKVKVYKTKITCMLNKELKDLEKELEKDLDHPREKLDRLLVLRLGLNENSN